MLYLSTYVNLDLLLRLVLYLSTYVNPDLLLRYSVITESLSTYFVLDSEWPKPAGEPRADRGPGWSQWLW